MNKKIIYTKNKNTDFFTKEVNTALSYNVIDLLDKAIMIAKARQEIYMGLEFKSYQSDKIYIFRNALNRGLERNVQFYESLKKQAREIENIDEIDFKIYDRISFLINEFKTKLLSTKISNIKHLLNFSLDLEIQVLALYIDIQGRLFQSEGNTQGTTYKIISHMLKEKEKNISDLEKLLITYLKESE